VSGDPTGTKHWLIAGAVALVVVVVAIVSFSTREERVSPPTSSTAVPPPKADLSQEHIDKALNKDLSYEDRVNALGLLPNTLTPAQAEQIRQLAKTKKVHPTVRNDCLTVLARQNTKIPALGSDLAQMWKDREEDATWHDYVLQHMEAIHDYADNQGQLEQILIQEAEGKAEGETNFPGTALLSLQRLAEREPRVAKKLEKLTRDAVLAEKKELDPEKVVTALQVARRNGDTSVLERARELAQDESVRARLRMSAIGTIGTLGERIDIPLLEKLAKVKDDRIRTAAEYNLKALKKKHNT